MKRLLFTAAILSAVAGTAFAQGSISVKFLSATTKVYYSPDGTAGSEATVPSGGVTPYGSVTIAVYSAAPGTALTLNASLAPVFTSNVWSEAATKVTTFPIAGETPATQVNLNGIAEGANAQVEIVAWAGSYTDFASAYAAGAYVGWVGSALSGGSLSWTQGTGQPSASPAVPPVATPYGAGGVENLVLEPVPEPSTIALAGLGAAGLLLFRRRK